ncbi:MAG: hypothetical protein ABW098_07935 [Candidatus Thiodiazotropha sp.]
MNIVTKYMGLTFFWYNIKDLGGCSESEFTSALEAVKSEYSTFPQMHQDYILYWVQSMDKLAKAGINLPFTDTGIMFINEALKQNQFSDIKHELNTVLSELNELSNKSDEKIAKRLIE